jgi:chromosome segregation ATPase
MNNSQLKENAKRYKILNDHLPKLQEEIDRFEISLERLLIENMKENGSNDDIRDKMDTLSDQIFKNKEKQVKWQRELDEIKQEIITYLIPLHGEASKFSSHVCRGNEGLTFNIRLSEVSNDQWDLKIVEYAG